MLFCQQNQKKIISEMHEMRQHVQWITDESNRKVNSMQTQVNILYRNRQLDFVDIIPDTMTLWGNLVRFDNLWMINMMNLALARIIKDPPEALEGLKQIAFFDRDLSVIFKSLGAPLDLRVLMGAESGGYHLAVSSAKPYLKNGGAVGHFQIMYPTSTDWHVEINKNVDMRRDTWKMAEVVAEYYADLKNQMEFRGLNLNRPASILRSYNGGLANFIKAAKEQRWVTDAWFIDRNMENNLYLFANAAWKFVYNNPELFGIKFDKAKYACPPLREIKIRLAGDAKLSFLELSELVEYQPSLFLETINPGYIAIKDGNRAIAGTPGWRSTIRTIRLPLEGCNIDTFKKAKIPGVSFLN